VQRLGMVRDLPCIAAIQNLAAHGAHYVMLDLTQGIGILALLGNSAGRAVLREPRHNSNKAEQDRVFLRMNPN